MLTFNTLEYVETLIASGVPSEQAKAQAKALSKVSWSPDVATKIDVSDLKTELKSDISELKVNISELKTELKSDISELKVNISELKTELKGDISNLKDDMSNLKNDVSNLKTELIRWFIGIGFSIAGIMFIFLRLMLPS